MVARASMQTAAGYKRRVGCNRARAGRRVAAVAGAVVLLAVAGGCTPVGVRAGEVTVADVAVPRQGDDELNLLAIGTADADGRILLRTTGASVARGETIEVGVMGPGLLWGAQFLVVGLDIPVKLVRFAVTQGGGIGPQPAAVLRITVPEDAAPGLYSILVTRFGHHSIFSGGLEVT